MSTRTVVGRMFWKEFCALRMVWIACVLGVLFLNATITVSAAAYNWQGYSAVFWALAMVVPAAYVVACTAMTFAGEREDRTADWLVALAPPFAPMYVSKQMFILLSGLAMQVFLAGAAACFALIDRTVAFSVDGPGDLLETLRVSEFVFLECLVWGTFWSLQTGKAVNAIFKTVATLILIFVISGFSMDWARLSGGVPNRGIWYGAFDTFGWLRTSWTVAVIAGSWVLGQRWLNGRAFEWEAVAAKWFHRRATATPVVTKELAEPWQRTWQRLWWLERQSIKSFSWMVIASAVLSLPTIVIGNQPTLAFMMSFGCLVILTGGLMAWRGEQTRYQYRLLVNAGVSPTAVWANKLLMWFGATLIALLVVALPTLILWQILSAVFPRQGSMSGPKWPSLFDSVGHEFSMRPDLFRGVLGMFVTYGTMMFAATFAWSLLCRKSVIAFGMALVTMCALGPWYGVIGSLGMPMWLFLAPLPIWFLAISYRHLPAWWLEQSGWRVWLARSIEFVIVPAALIVAAMAYRVYEVPGLKFDDVIRSPIVTGPAMPGSNAPQWQAVVNAVKGLPAFNPQADEIASGGAGMGMAAPPGEAVAVEETPSATEPENSREPDALDRWVQDNAGPLFALRQAVDSTQGLMNQEDAIWQRANSSQLQTKLAIETLARKAVLTVPLKLKTVTTVSDDTQTLETQEKLWSDSPEWLQAACILGGATRRYAPFWVQRVGGLNDDGLFREMVAWAEHPDQTEETLRRGLNQCASAVRMWSNTADDVRSNLQFEKQVKENRRYWPWEEARRQRLLEIEAINQATYLSQVAEGRAPASAYPSIVGWYEVTRKAWHFRPGDDQMRYYNPFVQLVVGLDNQTTIELLHGAETRYRATIATMLVVGHRRLHGRLPASLTEAVTALGKDTAPLQNALRDPWSLEWFHYEPAGFPIAEGENKEPSLQQPILWSPGPYHQVIRLLGGRLYAQATIPGGASNYLPTAKEFAMNGIMMFPIPEEGGR